MSSSIQIALNNIFLADYISLVILVAVGYDYVLTFSKEIEYIWSKPWTWVSTLFVFLRYSGLCNVACTGFAIGSSFFPGPEEVMLLVSIEVGEIVWIIGNWAYGIFLCSADLIMLLRVWAMYNRSRPIFMVLLAFFILEIVFVLLVDALYSDPKNLPVFDSQILSYCTTEFPTSYLWTQMLAVLVQATGSMVICTLAIVKYTRGLLQTYRMTKRWELNRYMDMLVKQGVVFFVMILSYQFLGLLTNLNMIPTTGWQSALTTITMFAPVYTLTPRFVISMRELHAWDVRHEGFDSAFGLSSSRIGVESAIMFEDVEQNEPEVVEGIPMEVTEVGTSQSD